MHDNNNSNAPSIANTHKNRSKLKIKDSTIKSLRKSPLKHFFWNVNSEEIITKTSCFIPKTSWKCGICNRQWFNSSLREKNKINTRHCLQSSSPASVPEKYIGWWNWKVQRGPIGSWEVTTPLQASTKVIQESKQCCLCPIFRPEKKVNESLGILFC